MIFGTLQTWEQEKSYFPSSFATALSFLQHKDLTTFSVGKYQIRQEAIFALIQEITTEPASQRRFESHLNAIDIQLVLSGHELQQYAQAGSATILENHLVDKDIAFHDTPKHFNSINLTPGDFAIYLPGELHCPCCIAEHSELVKKIVFKIHKNA